MKKQVNRSVWVGGAMAVLILVGTMTGCTTTQQVAVKEGGLPSGFLGDTSLLKPGDKEQASLRYVNPNAP